MKRLSKFPKGAAATRLLLRNIAAGLREIPQRCKLNIFQLLAISERQFRA